MGIVCLWVNNVKLWDRYGTSRTIFWTNNKPKKQIYWIGTKKIWGDHKFVCGAFFASNGQHFHEDECCYDTVQVIGSKNYQFIFRLDAV